MTDQTPTIAPGTLPGRARAPGRPSTVARRLAIRLWAAGPGRQRPFLDSEPRRTPGLEVKPSHISLTPQSMRLDLPPVPPRQRPANANHHTIRQRNPLTNTTPYQSKMRFRAGVRSRTKCERRPRRSRSAKRFARRGSKAPAPPPRATSSESTLASTLLALHASGAPALTFSWTGLRGAENPDVCPIAARLGQHVACVGCDPGGGMWCCR